MVRSRRSHLVILLALLLVGTVALMAHRQTYVNPPPSPRLTRGCFDMQEVRIPLVPLPSLGIKTQLFVVNGSGRLLRFDPGTGRWTTLADHDFVQGEGPRPGPSVEPSADGRWISYNDDLDKQKLRQYWLYDRHSGTDRLVLQTPSSFLSESVLSPDGHLLAIAANFNENWPDDQVAGLYLFDTATLKQTRIVLPGSLPFKEYWARLRWSADGKEILIKFQTQSDHNDAGDYAWNVLEQRLVAVRAGDDAADGGGYFLRSGKRVALAPEQRPQSQREQGIRIPIPDAPVAPLETELSLPSGLWHAKLGMPDAKGNYALEVKGGDGKAKTAFVSHFEPCNDRVVRNMPRLAGWLDERFLVYQDADRHTYVFDPVTGGTASLFDDTDGVAQFMW